MATNDSCRKEVRTRASAVSCLAESGKELNDNPWVSGEWTGFYLESHHDRRGWMHLYLEFQPPSGDRGTFRGEGTDYVGPWNLTGEYSPADKRVGWVKRYVGRHLVRYDGTAGENGIVGHWSIAGLLSGRFHIWPQAWGQMDELYLAEELRNNPSIGKTPSIFTGSGGVMEPAFDPEPPKSDS